MEEALKELKKASSALRARQTDREKLVANDARLRAALAEIESAEESLSALRKQRAQHLAESTLSGKAFDVVGIDEKIAAVRKTIEGAADNKFGIHGALAILETQLAACDDDIETAKNAVNDAAGDCCVRAFEEAKATFHAARETIRASVISMAAANSAADRFKGIGKHADLTNVLGLVSRLWDVEGSRWLLDVDSFTDPERESLLNAIEAARQ